MNNSDLRNLTEAYNQVFLKENEIGDLAKQDPREGFPSHEQERHENHHNPLEIKRHVEAIISVLIPELKNDSDAIKEISDRIIDIVNDFAHEHNEEAYGEEDENETSYNQAPPKKGPYTRWAWDNNPELRKKYGSYYKYMNNIEDSISYSDENLIIEAKKAVSAKRNINPWAVERALENKTGHHYNKKNKEKIVKGIKMGAKKQGKKIISKAVKKK